MTTKKITIIDYGMGNLTSVSNALQSIGVQPCVSNLKDDIINADAIVLPGIGAFGQAMQNLRQLKLIETLQGTVLQDRKPFLGICLGMQLLASQSEENGVAAGLGWIPGKIVKIPALTGLRVPHTGWNQITRHRDTPIVKGLQSDSAFYFVHSYVFECDPQYVVAFSHHGIDFPAIIQMDHIVGTQFHPEKSSKSGIALLKNFVSMLD